MLGDCATRAVTGAFYTYEIGSLFRRVISQANTQWVEPFLTRITSHERFTANARLFADAIE